MNPDKNSQILAERLVPFRDQGSIYRRPGLQFVTKQVLLSSFPSSQVKHGKSFISSRAQYALNKTSRRRTFGKLTEYHTPS